MTDWLDTEYRDFDGVPRALERLPDIPVWGFPFDVAAREFLPYDSIASMLGE